MTILRKGLLQLGLFLACPAMATVTSSVAPSAISNTYAGTIVLQIAGLGAGETVIVQKYLDLNGNGVIDTGDLLVQQFELTDGQATLVAGVTNGTVPGDWNTAAGAITTPLSLFQGGILSAAAGRYAYVVSSPTAHFSPSLTNFFSVTNTPYPQTISGIVKSGSAAVPDAYVLVLNSVGGKVKGLAASAAADSAGSYSVRVPPGTYIVAAGRSNYVANFSAAILAINPGDTVSTNLSLVPATNRISGRMLDASDPSIGLPGLFVPMTSADGFVAFAFTDAKGNFSVGVNAGTWSVNAQSLDLAVQGYMGYNSHPTVAVSSGTVSTNLTYPKATGLFYGTVKDNLGNPLPGVRLYGDERGGGVYSGDAEVDGQGNYFMGVVASTWDVEMDLGASGPQFASYVFSQAPWANNGSGISVSGGTSVRQDFTALLATNQIRGHLKDAVGNPITGVQINATATINGSSYSTRTPTDANGNYALNVANGSWNVSVNCCTCNSCSCLDSSVYQCPNSQNVNISNGNESNINFIAPPAGSFSITGSLKDNNNLPVVGVNIHANNGNGTTITTGTDGNGDYAFNVSNGNWDIGVDCGQLDTLGYACPNDQMVQVSNGGVGGVDFMVVPCGPLQVTTTSLPDGMVSFAYYYNGSGGVQLQNSGCHSPFTWSPTPGSLPLPAGLSLSQEGWISGTPTASGTNYFSVRVSDASANAADALMSMVVWPTVQITNASLPNPTAGLVYGATLGVVGGAGGYFDWYISSGALPPGLYISGGPNRTGVVSGTPTQTGTFSFTVSVYDNSGYAPQRAYSLTVQNGSPVITTTNLAPATVSVLYSAQVEAVGGATPYGWSLAPASQPLPASLILSTNGLIAGVPATSGTFSFILRVTDANALSTTAPLMLTVNPGLSLGLPVLRANQIGVQLLGATPGQSYTLQVITNLTSSNWVSLYATNAPSPSFLLSDPNATSPMGFYRVKAGP
jgi:hypothetical protein